MAWKGGAVGVGVVDMAWSRVATPAIYGKGFAATVACRTGRHGRPGYDPCVTDTTAASIPEGFRLARMGGPYMNVNGPLYARLDAGELSLNDFLLMEQRHQAIVNQANAAIYDATERLAPIAEEFQKVEAAIKDLERQHDIVKKVADVLNVSAQLLLAVSALALLFFDPNPGTVAATASAIFDVSRTIRDTASH